MTNTFTFKTGKKRSFKEKVCNPHPKQNYEHYLILCKLQINSLWQRRILSFHGPVPKIQMLLKKNSPVLDARFQATYRPFGAWLTEKKKESEVAQSCPTLCDPVGCSLPVSSIHGTLQARILEWVAISFSRGSSRPQDPTRVSGIAGRRVNL